MNQLIIDAIKQAAGAKKVLRIIYIEKDGTSEGWRYIEPYNFSYDDAQKPSGLFAWDRGKNGIRRFTLERIEQAETTEESFTPRYEIKISWPAL